MNNALTNGEKSSSSLIRSRTNSSQSVTFTRVCRMIRVYLFATYDGRKSPRVYDCSVIQKFIIRSVPGII
ncbi:hypothetical protein L596_006884 [Steinernema carpocapsae]|uniref:Uncharacterized protein n=1 Tax=Steinernema carpocapsae TaxID=34508 RepID=A0A4U5P7A2_STECR|nr:hypothetical protein L596_006884 [Steinernema carpocapsae]